MATVRMTPALIDRIIGELHAQFESQVEKIRDEISALPGIGQYAYDQFIPDAQRPHVEALHRTSGFRWCSGVNHMLTDFKKRGESYVMRLSLPLGEVRPVPATMGSWEIVSTINIDSPEVQELFPQLLPKYNRYFELVAEREAAEQTARTLLSNCPTLKAAIKLWPSVLNFLPPHVLERHHASSKRTPVPEPDIEVPDDFKLAIIKLQLQGK